MSDLLGDVQAESVHDVSEEEQVDLAFAIPVVDVADVLNLSLVNLKKEDDYLLSLSFCSAQSSAKIKRLPINRLLTSLLLN